MNFLQEALSYIFTAANWSGPAGIGVRIVEHLQYTAIAVVFSVLVAIPIGLIIGHTGRGTFLVVTGVNALRALPTLGVLLLGVVNNLLVLSNFKSYWISAIYGLIILIALVLARFTSGRRQT